MKEEKIKALFYSQGEAQGQDRFPFELTLDEFKENIDKYPLVITNGYSEVLGVKAKSKCWLINDHAVFRIVFSNGIVSDRDQYDSYSKRCPFINTDLIHDKEYLESNLKWIDQLNETVK